MAAKLRVSLTEGVFEAEGDDAFVEAMHSEFQKYIGQFFRKKPLEVDGLSSTLPLNTPPSKIENLDDIAGDEGKIEEGEDSPARGRRAPTRRRRTGNVSEGSTSKKVKYEPRVDPDLKLPGLLEAFNTYELKGHQETVLFFGHYLAHDAGISPFSADHIFTCYRIVKVKPPKAFAQALYDTRTKRHFLKFDKLDAISMTHFGDTHYEHDLKKKE